jgi:hypothetical protein
LQSVLYRHKHSNHLLVASEASVSSSVNDCF